ncbi:CD109 antigen [Drosophila virilis]|uniref:Thioester-containing protein 6 n=1 Tax=Drosophila virilis TaxID=7244 RepID=B4LSL8_DROVI|nr:CD109 antigen [Drosophila virilis]EDW64840.1 Thioester-containing protein 6 [Drosophila virilis]
MQRLWHMLHALLLLHLVAAQNDGSFYNVQPQQQQPQQPLQQPQPTSAYDNNPLYGTNLNPNLNPNLNNPNPNPTYGYNELGGAQEDYNKRLGSSFGDDEPSLQLGKTSYNVKASFLETLHNREPTYFIVASRMVRPGLIYQVSVSILQAKYPITVHASISCDGVQISGDSKDVKEGVPETLLMRIPPTSVTGDYKLRVEGFYQDVFGGIAFLNETRLDFSQRSMTIFVQTDKPLYMQGETVRFRTIPITTELKGFDNAIDVYMLDPNKHILKRWLSRQSNLGSVSLEYKLSDQPTFGEWTIRVIAQGQQEESHFSVEEYYQTRFEVNVTMPAYFFTTDPYIYGRVMANFTSGLPVRGNLTLKATIRPIGYFSNQVLNEKFRLGRSPLEQMNLYNERWRYNNPSQNPQQQYNGPPQLPQDGGDLSQDLLYRNQYVVERNYQFEEEWPFWVRKPEVLDSYDSWTSSYRNTLPYLRYFNGTFDFKWPLRELELLVPNMANMEVLITATVGEKFYDEIISGYAVARVYNSSLRVAFLGESPQVFKPAMPFTTYLVVEYHDGSPINPNLLRQGLMEVSGFVESRNGGRRDWPAQRLHMSQQSDGVWELKIDIRNDLQLDERPQSREFLNGIQNMRLQAVFADPRGERVQTELLLVSHYSPRNQHIKITTSTEQPVVGEYIIFHIRTNFYLEEFNYLIMSKGVILINDRETIIEGIRTIAVVLSAEMAPVATLVVWKITQQGQVVADSLTFPVNGISRNNFTVYINNRKARTGEKVEVAIFGEPGSYVGLSGIDSAFYTMQAGNELTYAKIITKMSNFDEQTNGTYKHIWYSHEGNPDELVYFPASSFGIDANRTFEYSGLIVFTDGFVPRRQDNCNRTLGYGECLSGRCYRLEKRCDGLFDCEDGTDEIGCHVRNDTELLNYRKYRFNRVLRHYENVWLWKDVNIGPHGRYIFNVDVPDRPAFWMVSAFSVSPSKGFGMLNRALEYVGVQPFFINVEMPSVCRQGEQVGIRVTVFNYMTTPIEAIVVLHGSPNYKFVHVEEDGIVRSYNPRTSFGEHQFFIYLDAQGTTVVYVPVVPQRLGEIEVTLHVATLLGTDTVTRTLHVESDGLPQYRHQSVLLDLSNRAYVLEYMHVNITQTPEIPYQVDRYFVYGSNRARISVVGDVVGPIFPTMPVNASSLLYLPMESAEQNAFSFAANLYTIMYMRLINQRNKTLEKNAFYHMNIGYQRQLSYMRADGSFSLFRSDWNNSASSVWLTSYCLRIFQEASFYEWENFIWIDATIIEKNMRWLLQHQTPEGAFYEVTWLPDRKINRTNFASYTSLRNRNITLTSHVLITLATVKDLSGTLGSRVALATQRAVAWIERNMQFLKDTPEPYDVAITAYALQLCNSPIAEHVFSILRKHARTIGDFMYWGNQELPQPPRKLENQKWFSLPRLPYEYDSLNIETTAYALLVYVARREFFVDPIVRWLNAQRLNEGGWASTQDTSAALRALVEYTVRSRIREVSSLSVEIEASSQGGKTQELHIDDTNLARLQSIEIPDAWGTIKVQAKGAGYAILQMHVQYNVDIEKFQTKPPVPAFGLHTKAIFHGRNQSHISYVACQNWVNLQESERSGMAVLDVAIPTGYWIQQQKLDTYVLSNRVRNLRRARYLERKIVFYFDYLDQEDICVNFTIERWYPVANMSRYLPVRIYDYYAPERFNESIFDALPTYLLNICEVCGSSQCPYCSIYNMGWRASMSFSLLFFSVFIYLMRSRLLAY